MSDQEIGKKEVELYELYPFLEAYKWATRQSLSLIESGENPDFLCARQDGGVVGVELTKVTRDPRDIFWEKVLNRKKEIDPYETQEYIHHLIEKKETARVARYSLRIEDNILVLQLVDGSLDSLKWILEELEGDFADHGFSEIWLADYSGLKAYRDIELFGLYPKRWCGYHQRPRPDRKPYG